ncbi:MAG: DUF177 domain-containing protein [Oscillospiraceae bacterium]|nr:DUF177 domain-containing protein [Oscillospiraceae bacterium]
MFLELEPVLNTPGLSLPFSYELPEQPSEAEEGGGFPFAARPKINGLVKNRAGIVTLEGSASLLLAVQCARCAAPFRLPLTVALEHTLVRSRASEESDALVLVEQFRYSPDALVWEDIVLAMPQRFLCREDCRGVCPQCGQNRNEGICACRNQPDGQRPQTLRQLLAGEALPPVSDV